METNQVSKISILHDHPSVRECEKKLTGTVQQMTKVFSATKSHFKILRLDVQRSDVFYHEKRVNMASFIAGK